MALAQGEAGAWLPPALLNPNFSILPRTIVVEMCLKWHEHISMLH